MRHGYLTYWETAWEDSPIHNYFNQDFKNHIDNWWWMFEITEAITVIKHVKWGMVDMSDPFHWLTKIMNPWIKLKLTGASTRLEISGLENVIKINAETLDWDKLEIITKGMNITKYLEPVPPSEIPHIDMTQWLKSSLDEREVVALKSVKWAIDRLVPNSEDIKKLH